ncbi:DUF4113 domain-containing protein [Pseudomonas sp. C 49-2]|nr:DUF4113 domain-containing protein [Pseudomonas sp. C 49-2]
MVFTLPTSLMTLNHSSTSASVPGSLGWTMRREMMSQSYTTTVDQLWAVECK